MKNFNKFFGLFALILGAMVSVGCMNPLDGSSGGTYGASDSAVDLIQFGTTTEISVKVDEAGVEGYGNVIPYFTSGQLKYLLDIGTSNTATLGVVATSGTAVDSGSAIAYGYNQAVYFAYLPSGQTNWANAKTAVYEIDKNKVFFQKYNIKVTNKADPNQYLNSLAFMKYGNSYYGKVPASSTVRVAFSDYTTNDLDYPTSTTGVAFTANVDIQGYKYMLVSYWPRGADATDPTVAHRGYVEISGNSSTPSAKSMSSGYGYSTGQNVTLNVGEKVTFFVSASGVSELYYYVSQSAAEPSDKATIFSGKQNVASNGNYSIDVTYTGGTMYLFSWSKSTSGAYSSFFKLIVTQGGGTVTSVQSISLPANMTVNVGGSGTLNAIFNPTNVTNQAVNWSVSGTAATINSTTSNVVTVTPVSAGTVTITATAQDQTNGIKTASCVVTVTSSGTVVTNSVNIKIDSSWSGKAVEITFPVNGSWTNATKKTATIASDGRIPISIPIGAEFSIVCTGTWTDLKGAEGTVDYVAPGWANASTLTLSQSRNGTLTGATVVVGLVAAQ